jgi:myo-inositol-1(or 4)-monophosphatase
MTDLKQMLEFATETAFQAGQLTLAYFQTGVQPDFKSDDSPVTVADKKAEELIRARIEKSYPQHGMVGEEFGTSNEGASYRWFIDPIDGTKSFMRGVPLYGVLLGLEHEGKIVAGVSYFPGTGDMVYAASGEGCFWNGRRAYVSEVSSLSRAVFSFTDAGSFKKYGRAEVLERLQEASYYRVGWSDAYGHMLVATGRCEIMADPVMNPWDCGPFPIILREAGGFFGNWSGEETIYGGEALSCNGSLLNEVLALIGDAS